MAETWFISDHHFGHTNILKYEAAARPFKTIDEMNEAIINRWNSVVKKFDKVYHLGDFCFGANNIEIAKFLNGNKYLILGNHDRYASRLYLQYFMQLHGALFWNECILSHMPVHPNQLEHRAKYNIHGHLHSKNIELHGYLGKNPSYINVSCEQNNLTPINADELFK